VAKKTFEGFFFMGVGTAREETRGEESGLLRVERKTLVGTAHQKELTNRVKQKRGRKYIWGVDRRA